MKPAGPLMIEHRLIERMIKLLAKELQNIKQKNRADLDFMDTAVDFIRTYADHCHHGKEEDILFRDLLKKKISAEHKKILDELLAEHVLARKTVKNLIAAQEKYAGGDQDSLTEMAGLIQTLVELYPCHIEKEDKHFFIPCMDYFSAQEQAEMLNEFQEFDQKLIHNKYRTIVEKIETNKS